MVIKRLSIAGDCGMNVGCHFGPRLLSSSKTANNSYTGVPEARVGGSGWQWGAMAPSVTSSAKRNGKPLSSFPVSGPVLTHLYCCI